MKNTQTTKTATACQKTLVNDDGGVSKLRVAMQQNRATLVHPTTTVAASQKTPDMDEYDPLLAAYNGGDGDQREKPPAQHPYEVKPIPGFNGYLASSVGDIISSSHDWRGQGERVMTQTINQHGYPTVRLQIGRKRHMVTVHKLVLLAFRGIPAATDYEARHLNGIRHDNRLENLQWGTRTENAADREVHGNTARGPEHSDIIRASLRERQQAAEKLIVASVNHYPAMLAICKEIANSGIHWQLYSALEKAGEL